MYDQLGCGLSSTPSRPDLWHSKTWIDELIKLREYLNLNEIHYSAEKITESSPECLKRSKKFGTESYVTAWGQNEFSPSGTLKNFGFSDKITDIKEPCLITSGLLDLCSPLIAKAMYDKIPNSKWELFEYSRHMPFVQENEKYIKILIEWLDEND